MKVIATVLLLFAVITSSIALPLTQYPTFTLGSKGVQPQLIGEYVKSWWHKLWRRITGQVGPAESAEPTPQQPTTAEGSPTGEPGDVYDVVAKLTDNPNQYNTAILTYIENNGVPNKPAQVDVYIIPEQIYLTLTWDGGDLDVYNSWTGDQNLDEYIQVTVTSSVVMKLYNERHDTNALTQTFLQADGNGDLTYTIIRLNPALPTVVFTAQLVSALLSITLAAISIYKFIKKEAKR